MKTSTPNGQTGLSLGQPGFFVQKRTENKQAPTLRSPEKAHCSARKRLDGAKHEDRLERGEAV